jgi:hypothetical protein
MRFAAFDSILARFIQALQNRSRTTPGERSTCFATNRPAIRQPPIIKNILMRMSDGRKDIKYPLFSDIYMNYLSAFALVNIL